MAIFQSQGIQNERFSLLLLEPGEIYFEDFSVYYYPQHCKDDDIYKIRQRGHLKICSKSVVFVPKEEQFPVLKISLKNTTNIDEYAGDLHSRLNDKALTISSNVYTEMKKDNIISPYIFIKGAKAHTFSLNYVTIDDCLPLISQLHRASTLPPADQNTMISAIVMSRQSRVKFNTSWLDDLYEKVELECQADKIMPLVTNPGRLMVTTSRLYFQPFNNVERSPVIKVRLKDIVSLMKRRFLLKQIGLEIKCSEDGPSQAHLYLAFKTKDDRDSFYEKIMAQPEVNLQMPDQQDMTIKWQNGIISNYDYLMYLNSAADRSFFDLTQYPVMPWVIQDFTSEHLDLENPETFRDLSKPIGALNPERLERMKERYVDMPEPKFLYGSHYSTPGYVLFYLARLVPEYVLCLQNGKFDQPDRMFNSLWEVWQNCLNGAADFKELIPEFFDGSGEFMINSGVCNFGVRQDGRPIENVNVPPWATDSRDLIKKMREALECDFVSQHLHEWIDLIFGYKQRGEEAEKADNVFYYLTYEGSVDLDSIKDPNERACMEIQIMEFGQVPKQLFTTPHPVRLTSKEHLLNNAIPTQLTSHTQRSKTPETDHVEENTVTQTVDFTHMHKLMTFSKHKDAITDVKLCLEKKMAFSVSQDSLLKLYSLEEQRQLRSVTIANMALSSCIVMPDCKTVICGAWDNNVYFYSVEYGNILDTLHAHDDAIINIYWRNDLLFTASWDSTVKLWQMPSPSAEEGFIAAEYFGDVAFADKLSVEEKKIGCYTYWSERYFYIREFDKITLLQLDHDYGVSDIAVDDSCNILVSATREGHIYVWDLQKYALKNVFHAHEGVINAIMLDQGCSKIVSCGNDSYLRITDLGSGTEIFVKDIREIVLCVAMVNNFVILGTDKGHVQVWDMEKVQMLHQFEAHKGAVTCLHVTNDMHLLSGSEDRSVSLWRPTIK